MNMLFPSFQRKHELCVHGFKLQWSTAILVTAESGIYYSHHILRKLLCPVYPTMWLTGGLIEWPQSHSFHLTSEKRGQEDTVPCILLFFWSIALQLQAIFFRHVGDVDIISGKEISRHANPVGPSALPCDWCMLFSQKWLLYSEDTFKGNCAVW